MCVAIANMFDLRPHESSTLCVINTVMFLVLVLPVIFLVADQTPGRGGRETGRGCIIGHCSVDRDRICLIGLYP